MKKNQSPFLLITLAVIALAGIMWKSKPLSDTARDPEEVMKEQQEAMMAEQRAKMGQDAGNPAAKPSGAAASVTASVKDAASGKQADAPRELQPPTDKLRGDKMPSTMVIQSQPNIKPERQQNGTNSQWWK